MWYQSCVVQTAHVGLVFVLSTDIVGRNHGKELPTNTSPPRASYPQKGLNHSKMSLPHPNLKHHLQL